MVSDETSSQLTVGAALLGLMLTAGGKRGPRGASAVREVHARGGEIASAAGTEGAVAAVAPYPFERRLTALIGEGDASFDR